MGVLIREYIGIILRNTQVVHTQMIPGSAIQPHHRRSHSSMGRRLLWQEGQCNPNSSRKDPFFDFFSNSSTDLRFAFFSSLSLEGSSHPDPSHLAPC